MAEEGEEDRFVGLGADDAGEGLAAFALVFAGCGAIVTNAQYHGALGSVAISLVFGLIIMVMAYATGHLSRAHINPSVTIAFTLTRHFSPPDANAYIAAQLTGATLAALVLLGVCPASPPTWTRPPTVAAGSAFLYEAILTAFLMFVIMPSPPTPARSAPPRRSRSSASSDSTRCSAAPSPAPR